MKFKFPSNFKFGGATSGPQTEGWKNKKNLNVFDYWHQIRPNDFFEGVGPQVTSDFYNKFKSDSKLLKDIGIKLYRTSIQMTRFYDDIENRMISDDAIRFYREYFTELKKNNIEIILNLYHFDTPIYWQKKGGWENKEFVNALKDFAVDCFKQFGDLIDLWSVFNEPAGPAEVQYIDGLWYPFVKDAKRGIQVGYNEMLATGMIVKEFRKIFSKSEKKKISTILNITPAYPKDSSPENILAAKYCNEIVNNSFLNAAAKGEISDFLINTLHKMGWMPDYTKNEIKIIKENTVDFLGLNYYSPRRVKSVINVNDENNFDKLWKIWKWPDAKMNVYRGWEIFPKGIYDMGILIKEKYNNISWYLAENGMGVQGEEKFIKKGIINDQYRIDFIKEHLVDLNNAIKDGSNCFGYCIWSPIDCWSWSNAYKNRYGLIQVNLKTQKRTKKKSAYFYKELSDTNEFEVN